MKTIIPRNSVPSLLLIPPIVCFGFLPSAQAVFPAPDGGYTGANTAEGTSALFSLTTGTGDTALGFQALYFNAFPIENTAIGNGALRNNKFGCFNTGTGSQSLYNNINAGGSSSDGWYNVANGFRRCITTQPGSATRPLVTRLVPTKPLAIATSISDSLSAVLLANLIPPA
jgi:hypothetical protein